jgi:hypothetical protein
MPAVGDAPPGAKEVGMRFQGRLASIASVVVGMTCIMATVALAGFASPHVREDTVDLSLGRQDCVDAKVCDPN